MVRERNAFSILVRYYIRKGENNEHKFPIGNQNSQETCAIKWMKIITQHSIWDL